MGEMLLARIEQSCSRARYAKTLSAATRLMPCDARLLEQVRIVSVVDQCDALPGVVLHVEHQRLDLASGQFDRDPRPTGAAQLRLYVTKIDHEGPPEA